MSTIDDESKKERTVVDRNIESQTPNLIEESFVLCPKGNVVELDGATESLLLIPTLGSTLV